MSYDENFRKWQKSRESKTPGGVKIGIFRFIAVLLFCISTSPLWAAGCSSSTPQGECNCAGWFWEEDSEEPGSGECSHCGEDKYYDSSSSSCKDCTGDYTKSKAGASSASQCYREIACAGQSDENPPGTSNARLYNLTNDSGVHCIEFGSDDNHCFDGATSNSWTNQYHLEPIGGTNQKCYFNTRDCNLFTTSGIVSSVSGYAEWKLRNANNQTYEWDVVDCIKQEEYNGNNCKGIEISKPDISGNQQDGFHSWVEFATSSITYYSSGYYCKSCNAGYEVNNSTDATNHTVLCNDSSSAHICDDGNQVYICKCGAINRGYYRSTEVNLCNDSNCKRSFDDFQGLFSGNVNHPCGPGQTTDGGATSAADCHYTTQTRFCDAHGCFYLSGLNWDANNHTYNWNGETSGD